MSEIYFTKRANKDIDRYNEITKKKIINKLKEYSKNPHKYSKKLISSKIGSYRFKIGEYRVIFDMEDDKIIILRIGHRMEIYK